MAELFKDIGVCKKQNHQLVNGGQELQGKLTAIYFSAHWCPPCRAFTPILKEFYDKVKESGEAFEIVFVSFDRSEEDLKNYLAESHGDWLYIPFGSNNINVLVKKYSVSGVPELIVVKSNGDIITREGRADVQVVQSTKDVIAKWRSMSQ
ncbi:Thioredoxin domain-containing protein [Meloidogyne graminicola]|uniref:protein-disulfide reductase n=1 Tax=Meloidogyne graminicola TaxID=189291 RepID=A0A8T0A3T5_9BILA|nr:Thioredoxin domain-containing protein [Meloidogyne graminicola]